MIKDKILCGASEKGKIVVNRCLDRGYFINTLKLERLLILMQGTMLETYQKPLFLQHIIVQPHGLIIPDVDRELILYSVEFKERFVEHISLSEQEEKVVNNIIENYGSYGIVELNEEPALKILKGLCYNAHSMNMVPRELIKKVFTDYRLSNLDEEEKKKNSFQKQIKK